MRKHFAAVLLILSYSVSLLFTSGCNAEEENFIELNFPEVSSSESSDPSETIYTGNLHELTVALPLSDETVDLLMKLYYAKENGLFTDDLSGADISIEYLEAINTPWIVNTVTTTDTGASFDNLQSLSDDGLMPDIFLTNDIASVTEADMALSFDPYLSESESISSVSVYIGALESLRVNNEHYGIPFYTSVYMLAGDIDYVPESGVPAFNLNEEELLEYIGDIEGYSSDENSSVTRFYDADSLRGLVSDSFINSLENSYLSSTMDDYGADPRISRTCGMWLMSSNEFDTWNTYYPDSLYFVMLPGERVDAVVYPVCVSSSCEDVDFAMGFASFICFDKDAQMLIHRLEELRGFFPPISANGVWDQISSDERFGAQAMLYEQFMDNAVYTASQG